MTRVIVHGFNDALSVHKSISLKHSKRVVICYKEAA